jgi:hypothetical protein
MGETLIALDPTSGPLPEPSKAAARRTPSLEGAVIGVVSNGLGRSDEILRAVYDEVAAQTGAKSMVFVRKHSVSVPPEPFDWERLISQVTVAVAGFGG